MGQLETLHDDTYQGDIAGQQEMGLEDYRADNFLSDCDDDTFVYEFEYDLDAHGEPYACVCSITGAPFKGPYLKRLL
jgi:hypothetical protein